MDIKDYILARQNLTTECGRAEEERQCSEQSAHPEYVARVTNAACSECGATEGGADKVIVLIALELHHLSHTNPGTLYMGAPTILAIFCFMTCQQGNMSPFLGNF